MKLSKAKADCLGVFLSVLVTVVAFLTVVSGWFLSNLIALQYSGPDMDGKGPQGTGDFVCYVNGSLNWTDYCFLDEFISTSVSAFIKLLHLVAMLSFIPLISLPILVVTIAVGLYVVNRFRDGLEQISSRKLLVMFGKIWLIECVSLLFLYAMFILVLVAAD